MSLPVKFQRVEGGATLLAATSAYFFQDYNPWLIPIFILLPDISMAGYLKNPKVGAVIYNIGHTYIFPLVTLSIGLLFNLPILSIAGLIWTAHNGMDRMFGFGLKFPDSFKHTHLEKGHSLPG